MTTGSRCSCYKVTLLITLDEGVVELLIELRLRSFEVFSVHIKVLTRLITTHTLSCNQDARNRIVACATTDGFTFASCFLRSFCFNTCKFAAFFGCFHDLQNTDATAECILIILERSGLL